MTPEQVDLMARYVQQEPPTPPEFGMKEMEATWKVVVPPDQRPTKKMNSYNIDNIFSTTLRDAGEDRADRRRQQEDHQHYPDRLCGAYLSDVGVSGRYLFVIGRDARINLIDLWMEKPDNVAEIKVGLEARSVDTSKSKGYRGQVRDRRFLLAAAVRDHGTAIP